jgi:predicted Zn-dependent protease
LVVARRLQARQPDEAMGYRLEGEVELRRQQYDAAAAALRKAAARRQAGDSALRLHLALVLGGKTAEAEQLAADFRKRHPGDLALDMQLGDLAMAGGDLAGAERHYLAVLARQPASVVTLNSLAHVMARQKRPGGAAMAEKALALAPGTPALMDTLALCLAAEQQLPRAITVQTQAVAAAPDVHPFRLQLAKLHLQAGDKASARGELGKLASLGSTYDHQAEVGELMRGLGR